MHASPRPDWLSTSRPAYAILLLMLVALLIDVGSELWHGAAMSGSQPQACTDLPDTDARLACYDHEFHHSPAEPARDALAPLGHEVIDPHE
jgi:hypothetical protein